MGGASNLGARYLLPHLGVYVNPPPDWRQREERGTPKGFPLAGSAGHSEQGGLLQTAPTLFPVGMSRAGLLSGEGGGHVSALRSLRIQIPPSPLSSPPRVV